MVYDLAVPSSPFPHVDDVRIDPFNGTFAAGYRISSRLSARSRTQVQQVEWPSTSLIARSIARRRELDLVESEPGRACRVLLAGMKDLSHVSFLAHSPLLDLLEQMAARHGLGWYKQRLRSMNEEADPTAAVPAATDDASVWLQWPSSSHRLPQPKRRRRGACPQSSIRLLHHWSMCENHTHGQGSAGPAAL